MIDLNECYHFGTVTKPHGIKGNVFIRLNRFTFDDIKDLESVFIEIDGLPVPFFVLEYVERPPDSLIFQFEDIDDEKKAREICGSKAYILKSNIIKGDDIIPSDFSSVIGYQVTDTAHGPLGIVSEILDIDQNPILQIAGDKKEILLPLRDEFIKSVNQDKKLITVTSPRGLLDL